MDTDDESKGPDDTSKTDDQNGSKAVDDGSESDQYVPIQFPPRFFDKGVEPPAQKSINYNACNEKLFKKLEETLRGDEWNQLWNSPVGVCLKFYKLDFGWASRLVHYFLSFQIDCKKKYEIWSLINNSPLRFSLFEFEYLTGLNCDYIENLEHPDVPVTAEMKDFWKKLRVSTKRGPSVDDLMEALDYCGEWSREDRIRLGYLAIFVNFFEGKKRGKSSSASLARLVMDPVRFEAYPWGRLAFKKLIESVKAIDLTNHSYNIEGFVQVLQVWTYFALPEFGSEYGDPLPNNPSPLILAYQGSAYRKYVKAGMMKQQTVNNFVTKESVEEMWPKWDDEIEDEKAENLVRALYGEFGDWSFTAEHFPDEGVKPSNVIKLESGDAGEVISKNTVQRGDFAAVAASLKTHMDTCFTDFSESITGAVESFKTDIVTRISALEVTVKALRDGVTEERNDEKGDEMEKTPKDKAKDKVTGVKRKKDSTKGDQVGVSRARKSKKNKKK